MTDKPPAKTDLVHAFSKARAIRRACLRGYLLAGLRANARWSAADRPDQAGTRPAIFAIGRTQGGFRATPLIVRDVRPRDMPAIQAIYAREVMSGLATFEEVPPSVDELLDRRKAVLDLGLPYLAAELNGRVVGYCYAATYRPRPAYRRTVETSVYVADGFQGRGIGGALLRALISRCQAGLWRQMVAIIGDSNNAGSIALHRRFGFCLVGTLKGVGFKFGRAVDTVLMQRSLEADREAAQDNRGPADLSA